MDDLSLIEDRYFTKKDWRESGKTLASLDKKVARDTILRIRPGVYRLKDVPPHNDEDIVTAFLSANVRFANLTGSMGMIGSAAASLWGYPDLRTDAIEIGVPESPRPRALDPDIRLVVKAGWFDRPRRFVEHSGVTVLRPEWVAVDLLERGIGDRGHVRDFLDHAARTGSVTAGSLVTPLAELLARPSATNGTLTTSRKAIIVQLGEWRPDPSPGPIRRTGYGTDLLLPPPSGSGEERDLMDATRGYWVLDKRRLADLQWLVPARQGRTLGVLRVVSEPQTYQSRFWFDVVPETDRAVVDAFVGTEGRTFKPTRNPIRYWPPPEFE